MDRRQRADALLEAVESFAARPDPYAKAFYWIGRPGYWGVHVPRAGMEQKYDVVRSENLVTALLRGLTGEGLVEEKSDLDAQPKKPAVVLDRQPQVGYIQVEDEEDFI